LKKKLPVKKRKMRGTSHKKEEVSKVADENAPPKKRRGGRQKFANTTEDCSFGYSTDPNEDKEQRKGRI
jgi:hypothetical protein